MATSGTRSTFSTIEVLDAHCIRYWWTITPTASFSRVAKDLERILASVHHRDTGCQFFFYHLQVAFLWKESDYLPLAGQRQGTRDKAFIEHLQHILRHDIPESFIKFRTESINAWGLLALHALKGSIQLLCRQI